MRALSALSIALALVAMAACSSPTPTPTSAVGAGGSPTSTATPALGTPQAFFLNVLQPQQDSTVSAAQVTVSGQTTPDAVVTVNGQTVDVAADGSFSTTVTLTQGTNSIEVVASDFAGDQQSAEIPIIYIPQS